MLCAGVCHDTGSWTFVLWTLLSCVRKWMCSSSYTQAFPFFLLLSWVCLYWFSCVQRRRCSGSTTYKVQPRRHEVAQQTYGEPCNWSQDCVKHACTGVNACPWHRLCFRQIELVKRSCWSFPPTEIASLPPFWSCPKTVFPRVSLFSRWTTLLPVTCWYTSALFEGAPNKFLEISP